MTKKKNDITATYTDDDNEFLEIEFFDRRILRVNYRDLPFDISQIDDNFEISDLEFKEILQEGEWQ